MDLDRLRSEFKAFLDGEQASDERWRDAAVALADACDYGWRVWPELRRLGRIVDECSAEGHGLNEKADAIELATQRVRELQQEGGD